MRREDQTDEVKARLYRLTLMFVRKYQPRYYKQFRGDQLDLASEFYCQFLTAKSREKGKEASLLDKYDSSITSLEYLTKISVQRMLIDRSRADQTPFTSIERFTDEFGDVMLKTFGLTTEDDEASVDSLCFSPDVMETAKLKYLRLEDSARRAVRDYFYEVRNVISPQVRELFDFIVGAPAEKKPTQELFFSFSNADGVFECRCQQITPKTVCLLFGNEVYDFDRLSGAGRGKDYRDWALTIDSLERVKEFEVYKSGYDRKQIVLKFATL